MLPIPYDGGATFQNQIISDVAHITQVINNTIYKPGYAGDYIGMTAYNGKVYAAWMDNRSGTWQIYVSQVSDVSITGNSQFCTNSTYSISNLPAGATVNWSASPSGVVNFSCTTCSSTTLSKSSLGIVTLTAIINPGCGLPTTVSRNITVGYAPMSISSVNTGYCNGTYDSWTESDTPAVNGTSWLWTVDFLGYNSDIYIAHPTFSSTDVDVSGGGTLKLYYTDICGNNMTDGVTIYSSCHGANIASFDITPNPAINNASIKSNTQTLSKGNNKNSIYAIKILDGFGNQRKLFQYKSGITSITIPLSDLKSGIYLVSIFNGSTWISKSLIIQK